MAMCERCKSPGHCPETDLFYSGLPESLRQGFKNYIEHHIPMGGFGMAVLRNDLRDAVTRADPFNSVALSGIVWWLHNEAPGTCWGSPKDVDAWLAFGKVDAPGARS